MKAGKLKIPFTLKLSHQGLLLVTVLLAMEFTFVAFLFGLLNQAEQEARREAHAKEVVGTTNKMVQMIWECGQNLERYLISKEPAYQYKYQKAHSEIFNSFKLLRTNLRDDPACLDDLSRIEKHVQKAFDLYKEVEAMSGEMSTVDLLQIMRERKFAFQSNFNDLAATLLHLMQSQRKIQTESPEAQRQAREKAKQVLIYGIAGNVLIAFAIAGFFISGITSRLDVLVENTERMKSSRELIPRLGGRDEISRLDSVFHEMADALRLEEERLRASEERVRGIIESMPVGLIMIDRGGTIEYVNPMLETISGFQMDELVGKKVNRLFDRGEKEKPIEFLEEIRSKSVGRIYELTALRKNGEKYPVEFSLKDINTQDGPRQLAIVLDVTERHEIQKMRQAFVAMVSHELRTPLTSVSGFLELLGMGALGDVSEDATRQADRALSNVTRLIKLINDLLDLEKMESGTLRITLAPTTLTEIISDTENALKVFAEERGVSLDMTAERLDLIADKDRIVQVLVNLVSNAVKFSPQKSVVTVQAVSGDDFLEVRVIDRGRGIPARYREVIFERFQQVETGDAKRKGGTGLGLAISKTIVEQHGGSIGVTSEEGKGSTFWFRLPL